MYTPSLLLAGEVRYMTSDEHTVNNLTAYNLATSTKYSVGNNIVQDLNNKNQTVKWGVRIWLLGENGGETEITNSTSAYVTRQVNNGTESGIQSSTWAPPTTSMDSSDALLIRVYAKVVDTV
ncbi:MAG: hypothetical protein ACQEQC_05200, partial [Elusimicrobiota bacterium]